MTATDLAPAVPDIVPATSDDAAPKRRRPPLAGTRWHWESRYWAVAALLVGTALLYLINLSANGWGNDFYAAAAQAGGESWKAWLFGSLDPNNVITVDKPPAALWATGLSVRLFGLSSWSILVPQAVMGVLSVWVLYATVRRLLLSSGSSRTATAGGLLAGAILALTPAAVLIFRFNNPDALLVLLMTVAAYCTVRACQKASLKWLALVGVALGFAFLTKMLQGLLVLPGFGLAYLLFARTTWLKRIRDLAVATVALIVSAGWYVALVDLWPKSSRPYIGGSTDNSFMDLVLGYNGFARIFGGGHGGGGGGMGGGPGGNGATGTSFGGTPTLARLFSNEFGNEISWLLLTACLVLVAAVLSWFVYAIARVKGLQVRNPITRDIALGLTVFGSWLVVTAIVFGYMSGTVHPYYTVALAPAIAAVVAIGAVVGWRHRATWAGTALLAAMLVSATGWGAIKAHATGFAWPVLGWVLAVATVLGLAALAVLRKADGRRAALLAATLTVAGGITLGTFGIATANTPHSGSIPSVVQTANGGGMGGPGGMGGGMPGGMGGGSSNGEGSGGGQSSGSTQGGTGSSGQLPSGQAPSGQGQSGETGTGQGQSSQGQSGQAQSGQDAQGTGQSGTGGSSSSRRGGFGGGMGGPGGGGRTDTKVIDLLKSTDTTWAAATNGAQSQAGLQLESGRPVIAIGGFGGDPAPTLDQFKQWVKEGKIAYYVSGGFGGGGGMRGGSQNGEESIDSWVKANFTATTVGNSTVYKLTS
ncbi:MAG: glycosyltransferase family 39 protein [Gordonia sp. (in: high G+C Gram-positive bacteria)]|uniref:ArnT family glycosyltransferase n=1 Tax=Gordonia sp. (in: high G+C Gram-positive bacteria) TaxID=84139 RepID=UPI0039E37368